MKLRVVPLLSLWAIVSFVGAVEGGQGPAAGRAPGAEQPANPRAGAPIDLTGTWVSIVNEDWRYRMVTPAKGDYPSIPLNVEGRRVGDSWDAAKDRAAGDMCKAYGPPGLMRMPGRLRVSWQDDTTLKVEADAGTQTRLMHFGNWKAPTGPATLQGNSVASWELPRPPDPQVKAGSLKVVTTRMRPGYLRKNGVPYSANAVFTEYWDLLEPEGGDLWIVITSIVDDPTYLNLQWITSLSFKKEPDGSKWDPTPCSAE